MARPIANMKLVVLTLSNGEQRAIEVKTTTERYIRNIIADMILPASVTKWEVVKEQPVFNKK